jgi:RNA polymerase sigma-70 factor (ECF subfamily)
MMRKPPRPLQGFCRTIGAGRKPFFRVNLSAFPPTIGVKREVPVERGSGDRLDEELLVVRCQLGERAAFEALIRTWSGPLLAHLYRVAGPEAAEDLAQEVWIRVFRGIVRLREGARLKPWLLGIAHHVMMDRLRLRYAERDMAMACDAGDESDKEEVLALLESQLAALPVLERETLTLFYLEDLSLTEIAKIQAVPSGTVKSRLHRARGLLRDKMLSKGALA